MYTKREIFVVVAVLSLNTFANWGGQAGRWGNPMKSLSGKEERNKNNVGLCISHFTLFD
jgi:hypothetical protein